MQKTEEIRELYLKCKEVFEPSLDLFDEVLLIEDPEEKLFFETMANFFLQQKQKKLIDEGEF